MDEFLTCEQRFAHDRLVFIGELLQCVETRLMEWYVAIPLGDREGNLESEALLDSLDIVHGLLREYYAGEIVVEVQRGAVARQTKITNNSNK